MDNRIQKLSLDDTLDDEAKKEAETEIQDKCVSIYLLLVLVSDQIHNVLIFFRVFLARE